MADDDEQPTQVLSGSPQPPRGGTAMLEPHEPRLGEGGGGGGRPPYPPIGYGGDGNGDDWGDGDDGNGGDRRVAILGAIVGILVVIVLFLLLRPGGDDEPAPIATTEPTVEQTQAPEATATQEPEATATASPEPTATAEPEADVPTLTSAGITELSATQGDDVIFKVRNDDAATQEVHVHGYDRSYDVEPGETRTITFPATITGIFEIEFEATGTQIGELTVEP